MYKFDDLIGLGSFKYANNLTFLSFSGFIGDDGIKLTIRE
jgi:hypothetical protein